MGYYIPCNFTDIIPIKRSTIILPLTGNRIDLNILTGGIRLSRNRIVLSSGNKTDVILGGSNEILVGNGTI